MMRKICLYTVLCLAATMQMVAQPKFDKVEVKAWMKRVADWQIANPNKEAEHDDLDWTHAALYRGMVDWAELTEKEDGDSSYYQWLLRIGRRNHFQVGKWMYHADFIAVGQPFIDLYRKYGEIKMIAPVMARANWVVDNLPETTLELDYSRQETLSRWSWCDALFMAPPVYAKLYAQTLDKKYLNFLNREYKTTYDYLYDKEEQLFYRDHRYFDKREANGKKVFWGRGNGWVLGGKPMVKRCFGDGVTVGSWEDWPRFFRRFLVTNLRVNSTKTCLSHWPLALSACRVPTDIGMPVCSIRNLILRPRRVPQVLLFMLWLMELTRDYSIKLHPRYD